MDVNISFAKWQKDIEIGYKSNSASKHQDGKWFNSQRELVCINVFNVKKLPKDLQ